MIVELDLKKHEEIQKLQNDYRNYIVLDAKKFQYSDDTKKFKNSIEVLDIINTINWANDFYKTSNSDLRIDTGIVYKVINAGFTNTPFTDKELIEYFENSILIESFFSALIKFEFLENYTPYELEFVLFGLSYDEQDNFTENQKEILHDTYGNLFCDVRMKNLDVNTFIEKIKTLIEEIKRNRLEDAKKLALK